MKKKYSDPTAGLMHVQGNQTLHLALFLTLVLPWFIKRAKVVENSHNQQTSNTRSRYVEEGDRSNETCKSQVHDMNRGIYFLVIVHLMCSILLLLDQLKKYFSYRLQYFISSLSFAAIPLYQGIMLYINDLNTRNYTCYDSFGVVPEWFRMEIIIFRLYYFNTIWTLFKSRITNNGVMQNDFVS